jgi:hypothetical protein
MNLNENVQKLNVFKYLFLHHIGFIGMILNLIRDCVRFTFTSEKYPFNNTIKPLNPKM